MSVMHSLVNFNKYLRLRSTKARGHHRLCCRLAHLLQQRPVAENGGKTQSETVLETSVMQQWWRQIISCHKSPTASPHRSWPVRCSTSASIYLSNRSPSSSSRWPSGCCSNCSRSPRLTSGCWEGNGAIANTRAALVHNSREVCRLDRFSPSVTLHTTGGAVK